MSERDVETEVYERLYGLPGRERRRGSPAQRRISLVDGQLRPHDEDASAGAALAFDGGTHHPPRAARAMLDAGARFARSVRRLGSRIPSDASRAGAMLVAALARGRRAARDLRPTVDASSATVRRHPATAGALGAALIAVPLLALLLLSGGTSKPTRARLVAPGRPALPTLRPPGARRGAPRHSVAPSNPSVAEESSGAHAARGNAPTRASAPRRRTATRRRSATRLVARRKPSRRSTPHRPRRPRSPSIRQPASHDRPAHAPQRPATPTTPPATTPTTPAQTGGTGGAPAPQD